MAAKIRFLRSVWYSGKPYTERETYEVGKDISAEDVEHAIRHEVVEMADGTPLPSGGDTVLSTENTPLAGKGGGKK